jgi:hypothetical protein
VTVQLSKRYVSLKQSTRLNDVISKKTLIFIDHILRTSNITKFLSPCKRLIGFSDTDVLGGDAVYLVGWCLTFRRKAVPATSGFRHFKKKLLDHYRRRQ